ncbi:hypothetical protein QBC32DRAFT_369414 [Pseudoneurospora amorphoporcata]|uniref:C2H2-type domain-containing protein n=1 Tax=Pseudoneurospora amorphoporcata TaxID=241081 RepID=A0AAN6NYE3_9PEZI|nr:hypothetical protein QBC32DRAFT_369414 [Pseudoneurospora amorphoporcata]
MTQDVPHWRLQEQVPESAAPAPLSPHQEPQPEPATRPTAPAAPDTPPRPDAPRIPSPSSAPPATGPSTSAGVVEAPTSNPHQNSQAPSPTAKDDHQHLLAAPATSTSTATSTSVDPNSDSSTSSATTYIVQSRDTNGTVSDSAPTGGVETAAPGGSFLSSTAGASSATTVPRLPGSSTPTADRPALNGQPQQPQRPPAPSPPSIPDATNSAATSTSTSTPANATVSATDPATRTIPNTTTTASARTNFRDPIRWRDPITVQYDSDSGHAHPARLHAQPAHPSSSSSSQLPSPAQLKYEPSRQHQEHPASQPPSQSQPPAQTQPQPSARDPPAQARSHRPNHYNQPSFQFHPQHYHTQPPLQPAPAPVPSTQLPPPARSQRQSYQHHHQASQYQHQAPPSAHPQQHYQHSYLLGDPRHHPPSAPSQQQYHPHELRYTSRNDGLISKPIIMDPPRSRPVSQPPPPAEPIPSSGFPSPVTTHAHLNKKFADDCTRLTYAIQQSTPDAVRRVFRDNWEKCILGTEFHQAFILNASIHHAVPSITRRAVRDFGQKMVLESKHELISHFSTADLDDVADVIINKASDAFLDKCLNARLLTIEAKPLLTALAKAERLGYNPADIVEEQHERVMPTTQAARPPPPTSQSTYAGRLQCMGCYRVFTHQAPYEYHTNRQLCTVPPPVSVKGFGFSCQYCGEGFTRSDEHQSHERAQTCFHAGPASARGPGRPPRAVPQPQPVPSSIVPSSQAQATPAVARTVDLTSAGSTPSAETPAVSKSPNSADPYGHLTQEQLAMMDADLKEAEKKFAPRFAEAYAIPDENERRIKIEGLRNSFGTKQSMIRKKYGVRLRQRRTKAEIKAEEERMGLEKLKKRKKAEKAAAQQAAAPASTGAVPPRPAGSGWVAANAPRANAVWEEHEAKRRRMDASGTYQTPTKSTLSVSEIGGGLAGVAATAEVHDPTLPPPALNYQSANSNGQSDEEDEDESGSGSGSPSAANDEMDIDHQLGSGPASKPVQNNHNSNHNDDDDDDTDSSDDEDIPSTLPAHVRQTLATRNA